MRACTSYVMLPSLPKLLIEILWYDACGFPPGCLAGIPAMLLKMLEHRTCPGMYQHARFFWVLLGNFLKMSMFELMTSSPQLLDHLAQQLSEVAAACQEYGDCLADSCHKDSSSEEVDVLLQAVADTQAALLGPSWIVIDDRRRISPNQPALAQHIKRSSAIAAAAMTHLMGFCHFSFAKYSSKQEEEPTEDQQRSTDESSGPSTDYSSTNPTCSTSHSASPSSLVISLSHPCGSCCCCCCPASNSSSNSPSTDTSSGSGGTDSTSSPSSSRKCSCSGLALPPDHELVVVSAGMKRLAVHHAVIFSKCAGGILPCACYLLHGTLKAWILPAASADAAGVGRGESQNSSASNPKAQAASLMRLLVEATALLGPEGNLHLQKECLALLGQLVGKCSTAEVREFLGARGPVLLQVLGQLAPALGVAQPHQQGQEPPEPLLTAKHCMALLGAICMNIEREGKYSLMSPILLKFASGFQAQQ